jgi:Flp pilus assembly protein TadG
MRRGATGCHQRGQAAVELVLVLPVVVILLLLVLQVALVARAEVLVVHAAREGARAAAVDGTSAAAELAAVTEGLDDARLRVSAAIDRRPRGLARVRVRYRVPTDLPLVGPLVPDPELSAEVVMMVEDPATT